MRISPHPSQSGRRRRRPRRPAAAERLWRRGDDGGSTGRLRQDRGQDHLPDLEPEGQLQALLRGRRRRVREEVPRHRGAAGSTSPARATPTRSAPTPRAAPCPTSSTSRPTWSPRSPRPASPSTSARRRASTRRSTSPGAWKSHQIPGMDGTYAFPWYLNTGPLFYNKRLFKDAGLDADKPPKTYDQLFDDALRAGEEERRQGRHARQRPHHRGLRPLRRAADEQGRHRLHLQRRQGRRTPHRVQEVVRRQGAGRAGADRHARSRRARSSSPRPSP